MRKFILCKLCLFAFGAFLSLGSAVAGRDDEGLFECVIKGTTGIQLRNGQSLVGRDSKVIGESIFISYKIYDVPAGEESGKNDFWDYKVNVEGYGIGGGFQTKYSHSDTGTLTVKQTADEFGYFDSQSGIAISLARSYKEDWEGFATVFYADQSFLHGLRCKRQLQAGQ